MGQQYVETLGSGELARAAQSVATIRGLVDAGRIADLGGVSASISAASKAFGASSAASDLVKQFAGVKSMTDQFGALSATAGLASKAGLVSEAMRAAGMVDRLGFAAEHSAALAGLSAVPRIESQLSAVSKAFGASSAASDLVKQFAGVKSMTDQFGALSATAGLASKAGLVSEAMRAAGMVDRLGFAAEHSAALAGLSAVPRIESQLSAVSKAFGASSAASDLVKQFAGVKSMTDQFGALSATAGLASKAGLVSEAMRAAGMVDRLGFAAEHSAALAGLSAVPRIESQLSAVSKAFGASSAASDLVKQFAGIGDLLDRSALFPGSLAASLASLSPTIEPVRPVGAELVGPGRTDGWVQRDSGIWTRITPETYWAVLVTALFVSVCVSAYLSEMNRIGAPLSDTNRMSLVLEVAGLLGLAKSVDAATRWLYRLITGENPTDSGNRL